MHTVVDTCDGCGESLLVSSAHENDPNNPDGTGVYVTSNPIICHSCEAIEKKRAYFDTVESMKDRPIRLATKLVPRPRRKR